MDQYELIRTASRVYKKSIRRIARETGHHRKTIRKVLAGIEPGYRREKKASCPIMDPVAGIIEQLLKTDREMPKKQRHTARRIYTRLVEEHGFTGAECTVRRWVRQHRARIGLGSSVAVLPLDPEVAREAEVDWGSARVWMQGEERMVKIFCMRSRYSGKSFVRAYPWERQEMFFDAHMHAFAYYRGVFPVLVYDNMKAAIKQILRGKARVEQDRFTSFRSYYTFESRFCNPGRGNEKGGVEGLVGFGRRNFLVPMPEVQSFEELNRMLLGRCLQHGSRWIQGREDRRTIDQRHEQERQRLIPLPEKPYENSKPIRVRISRYSSAQVDRNRYSVPTAYVGRHLWAHVGCDKVAFYTDQKKVAEHPRIFSNSRWQIDPLHYLELVHERIGAFESARPIRQWRQRWPEQYETMLGMLRKRRGDNKGTREFVRILQLHQTYLSEEVEEAVTQALSLETYSFDAVKHLILHRQCPALKFTPLDASLIPGVTDRSVALGDIDRYNRLLEGGVQ